MSIRVPYKDIKDMKMLEKKKRNKIQGYRSNILVFKSKPVKTPRK